MSMDMYKIASIAHAVNRAYCQCIGDNSLVEWENAPDWQKKSVILGVRLHLDNPGISPAASHESWLAEKKKEGWKYGPVKDPVKKEHPCFLPYDDLPTDQKAKDHIFSAVVEQLKPFIT